MASSYVNLLNLRPRGCAAHRRRAELAVKKDARVEVGEAERCEAKG
ncbi:MAG: hypothetical protein ABIT06_07255 [Saprospiraceae bacterium]